MDHIKGETSPGRIMWGVLQFRASLDKFVTFIQEVEDNQNSGQAI